MLKWIQFLLRDRNIVWKDHGMTPIESSSQLQEVIAQSAQEPLFIFKHSTACPVSYGAFERVRALIERAPADFPPVFVILVIEHRAISNEIAAKLGVQHQSPQMLLLHQGAAAWSASHGGITAAAAEKALESINSAGA